jgi:hypothetical protein
MSFQGLSTTGACGARRRDVVAAWAAVLLLVPIYAFGADGPVTARVLVNTPERVVVNYTLQEPALVPVMIGGEAYVQPRLGKEPLRLEAGAPDLPQVCRSIVIPDNAEMAVSVLAAQFRDVQDVRVAPSKGNLLRTQNPADVPYEFGAVYGVDAFYPAEAVTLGEPYVLRDYRGVVIQLHPLQYNPVRGLLRVYTDVTVEIKTAGLGQHNVLERGLRQGRELSLAFHTLYQHQFLNYAPGLRYTPLDETGNMLIICYDAWLPNVQPLVTHKNGIGINTTAVGVSTIGNNSTAIKNYIQNLYNTTDLAFVLLVGDSTQVATPTASGGSSDPSYAKLAGSDNYPEIMVGRFSAETAAQVDTQVLRTVEYEQLQATLQPWFWRGTGVASNLGAGDDNEYDNVHIGNIRTDLLAHGYTQVDAIYDPSATAAQVSTALNAGRGIVNYCGHGSESGWTSSGFSSSNVTALLNDNMLPFVFSVACVNGQFAGGTCFAEAWLRSTHNGEPIGAIGAYMSSINQDWDPPMEAQDAFNALLVNAAAPYHSFGALCFAGSCSMMDAYAADGPDMFNTWHVFGDPSVRIVGITEPATGLKVTPADDLAAAGPVGGAFAPANTVYALQNKNATPLAYQVTAAVPWIVIANGSGSIPALSTVNVTVSFSADANGLAAGTHTDVLNFINTTDHDGDTTRNVSLVAGGPAWDPVALNANPTVAVSRPADITLSGTDPNGDPLTYEIVSLPASGYLSDPGAAAITAVPYALVGGGRVVTYQPPCGATLSDSFTFRVHDATVGSNVATVAVTVSASGAQRVYNFPLDTNPGWTTQGAWAFGTPTGGGTHHLDPTAGYTGTNVYGYNLAGDYTNSLAATYLTTTALNCANLTNTQLRFRRWLGVERTDRATVEVSNNGTTWTTLWQNPAAANVNDSAWSQQAYDLTAYADGQATVYVRWGMGPTDNAVTFPGWNVDDVEVWGVVPLLASDFNGDGAVNAGDVAIFNGCLSGPEGGTGPGCLCVDLDSDGDVDLADFAAFQSAAGG